jgi:hypothetical protein
MQPVGCKVSGQNARPIARPSLLLFICRLLMPQLPSPACRTAPSAAACLLLGMHVSSTCQKQQQKPAAEIEEAQCQRTWAADRWRMKTAMATKVHMHGPR